MEKEEQETVECKIVAVFSSGFVLIKYLNQAKLSRDFEVCKLIKLQFFNNTEALQQLSKMYSWMKNEKYTVKFLTNPEKSVNIPPVVHLFQEYAHGLVDINLRIRNNIHSMIKSEIKFFQKPQPFKFLRCDEMGNFYFQVQTCVTDKLLNFVNDCPKFACETVDSLESISALSETFLAPYSPSGSDANTTLQRMKIVRVMRQTKTVDVEFIDFKEFQNIKIENIFNASKVDASFAYLPSICILGHLANIVCVHVGKTTRLIKNDIVQVKLADDYYPEHFHDVVHEATEEVPEITVWYIDSNNSLVELGPELVKRGDAVPEKPTECDTKFRHIKLKNTGTTETLPSS